MTSLTIRWTKSMLFQQNLISLTASLRTTTFKKRWGRINWWTKMMLSLELDIIAGWTTPWVLTKAWHNSITWIFSLAQDSTKTFQDSTCCRTKDRMQLCLISFSQISNLTSSTLTSRCLSPRTNLWCFPLNNSAAYKTTVNFSHKILNLLSQSTYQPEKCWKFQNHRTNQRYTLWGVMTATQTWRFK